MPKHFLNIPPADLTKRMIFKDESGVLSSRTFKSALDDLMDGGRAEYAEYTTQDLPFDFIMSDQTHLRMFQLFCEVIT